ncbi:hypothetical protein lerEdw1_005727, partial [Lerista edwardsae]
MTVMEEVALLVLVVSGAAAQLGSRITGGFTCAKNSHPWHVGIYDSNRFYCSGTLLSRNWVVTAAHCKTPGLPCSNIVVRLGEHNMARNEGMEQQRNVAKQIVHPNYDPGSKDNDIMLMKLSSSVDINDSAQPISLATQCAPPGTRCLVTGWGTITSPKPNIPTELQCAYLIIMPQKECEEEYPDAITPNMVCAGWREGGTDSCQVRKTMGCSARVTPGDPSSAMKRFRALCLGVQRCAASPGNPASTRRFATTLAGFSGSFRACDVRLDSKSRNKAPEVTLIC